MKNTQHTLADTWQMTTNLFNLTNVHPSWLACIREGLSKMDQAYLKELSQADNWLPGNDKIFNAFSIPADRVNFILFGESPYPRKRSANGYAFWDASVTDLWSESGLSRQVNKATSFRNIIKMLLVAQGLLNENQTSQPAIAQLDKRRLVQTNNEFFNNLSNNGFLLLNASLVLQDQQSPQKDAKAWLPFISHLIHFTLLHQSNVKYLLFGKIANTIAPLLPENHASTLISEHPYNVSFITNKDILGFFKPLKLLSTPKNHCFRAEPNCQD